MARHDEQTMASTDAVATFGRFVKAERHLLALLEERLPQDDEMLVAMAGNGCET